MLHVQLRLVGPITAYGGQTYVTSQTGTGSTFVMQTGGSLITPTINTAASVGGTWTAAATWTLPAFTLGGTVTINGQTFSGAAIFSSTIAASGRVTTAGLTVNAPSTGILANLGVGARVTSASDAQAWMASNGWGFDLAGAWTRTASTAAVMWGTGNNAGTFEVWSTATGDAQSTAPADANSRFRANSTGISAGSAPATGLDIFPGTTGKGGKVGTAAVGDWNAFGITANFAVFGHTSVIATAGSYAVLQSSAGQTFLNSASGQPVTIRVNNADKFTVASSGDVTMTGALSGATSLNQVATANATLQSADLAKTALYAVTADGWYSVAMQTVVTRAATSSSTLPPPVIYWTDPDSSAEGSWYAEQPQTPILGNVVGVKNPLIYTVYAKSGTNISYATIGYATSGATSMQYAFRAQVRRVG